MDAIEALQPLIRVFQLFGLSVAKLSTYKYIPLHRIMKYYSILLIASRMSVYCYILMSFRISANSTLNSFVDQVVINAGHFVEIIILAEAFVKARQEEAFMENLTEIDRILIQNFDINLEMNKLRRSTVERLTIWMCITGTFCLWLIFTHHHTQYFLYALIGTLAIHTSTLTYFQIITWTDLIRYRLRVLNRLIVRLKYDQCERESLDDTLIDDSHVFNQLCALYDLYNRLWMQTNRLNERFKFTMVLSIANNFAHLVGLFYYTFLCLIKDEKCGFLSVDIAACMMNAFRLLIINIAGQNMADDSLQIAYALHRNKFSRNSTKLNSFVR